MLRRKRFDSACFCRQAQEKRKELEDRVLQRPQKQALRAASFSFVSFLHGWVAGVDISKLPGQNLISADPNPMLYV